MGNPPALGASGGGVEGSEKLVNDKSPKSVSSAVAPRQGPSCSSWTAASPVGHQTAGRGLACPLRRPPSPEAPRRPAVRAEQGPPRPHAMLVTDKSPKSDLLPPGCCRGTTSSSWTAARLVFVFNCWGVLFQRRSHFNRQSVPRGPGTGLSSEASSFTRGSSSTSSSGRVFLRAQEKGRSA